MSLWVKIVAALAGFLALAAVYFWLRMPPAEPMYNEAMLLASPAFAAGAPIPKTYTCEGRNVNPALEIKNAPAGAKSFALIMDDPDAPRGAFLHWLVWNLDPHTEAIPENFAAPAGVVEGKNGAGETGYTGPCPPRGHGVHHYHFQLYALDAMLQLDQNAGKDDLEREIQAHQLAAAELTGTYERPASP